MPPLTGPRGVFLHKQIFKVTLYLLFLATFYTNDPFSSNFHFKHCGVAAPAWGAAAAAIPEPKVTSDERLRGELTAILQEEARQKQEQLLKQGQLPQPDHVRQARQLSASAPPHTHRHHHVAKDVYQTLEIVPSTSAAHTERHKTDVDSSRPKRSIIEETRPPASFDLVQMSDAIVPMEPLSARVADVGYEKKTTRHDDEKSEKRGRHHHHHHGHRHKMRRNRNREKRSPYDDYLGYDVGGDEDLYDLFVDYFERPDNYALLRRKRSILSDMTTEPKEVTNREASKGASSPMVAMDFPHAERAEFGHLPKHQVSNSIIPPGVDPSDPDNVLTHEDIRDVTRQSDLGQILGWLEALSHGREKDVTAALLVAKKQKKQKHHKISSSSNSKNTQHQQSRKSGLLPLLPEDMHKEQQQHLQTNAPRGLDISTTPEKEPPQSRRHLFTEMQINKQRQQDQQKKEQEKLQQQRKQEAKELQDVLKRHDQEMKNQSITTATSKITTATTKKMPTVTATEVPAIPFVPEEVPLGPEPMPPPTSDRVKDDKRKAVAANMAMMQGTGSARKAKTPAIEDENMKELKDDKSRNKVDDNDDEDDYDDDDDTSEDDADDNNVSMERTTRTETKKRKKKKHHSSHHNERRHHHSKRKKHHKKHHNNNNNMSIENDYIAIL